MTKYCESASRCTANNTLCANLEKVSESIAAAQKQIPLLQRAHKRARALKLRHTWLLNVKKTELRFVVGRCQCERDIAQWLESWSIVPRGISRFWWVRVERLEAKIEVLRQKHTERTAVLREEALTVVPDGNLDYWGVPLQKALQAKKAGKQQLREGNAELKSICYFGKCINPTVNNMDEEHVKERREQISKEWDALLSRQSLNTQMLDKALLTLPSASLGFSLAFIGDMVLLQGMTQKVWSLYTSWIMFVVSSLCTLFSCYTSNWGLQKQSSEYESEYADPNNFHTDSNADGLFTITKILSVFSIILYILGIILTVYFVSSNLNKEGGDNMATAKTQSARRKDGGDTKGSRQLDLDTRGQGKVQGLRRPSEPSSGKSSDSQSKTEPSKTEDNK